MKSTNLEGGLSLRYVVNPRDRVQLSPVVSIAGGWAKTTGIVMGRQYDNSQTPPVWAGYAQNEYPSTYLSVRAGLVVEYRLLDRLHLRLENIFVRANREYSESRERRFNDGEKTTTSDSSTRAFSVNASIQPMLQLRILF